MIVYKIHEAEERIILCFCDKDLIGKEFEEEERSLKISKRFYNGKDVDDSVMKLIEDADIINIVGEESVNFMIEKKIIERDSVKRIGGIPHAQIFQNL